MVFQIHGGRKIPYSFGRIWCSLVVHSLIAEHLRMEIEVFCTLLSCSQHLLTEYCWFEIYFPHNQVQAT
jgi:hypothetical protein